MFIGVDFDVVYCFGVGVFICLYVVWWFGVIDCWVWSWCVGYRIGALVVGVGLVVVLLVLVLY